MPYVAFEGVALGVLGHELNGLPAAQRDAVAPGLVEDFARNPILGKPGLFWAVGSTAWIVFVVATVLAFRRAGAPRVLQILLGMSALIAAHARRSRRSGWCALPRQAGWCSGGVAAPAAEPAPLAIAGAA